MLRAFPRFFKGLWTALEQLTRKTGAVVRDRQEQGVFLQSKGDLQIPSGKAGRVADEIFRHGQKNSMVNLYRACIRSSDPRIQRRASSRAVSSSSARRTAQGTLALFTGICSRR